MSRLHLFLMPFWVTQLWLGAVTVLALWRGGWRERVVAVAFQPFSWGLVLLAGRFICSDFCCLAGPHPLKPWLSLINDLVLFAACAWSAWRADRYWIIWAGALAWLSVLTDALAIAMPGMTEWAYSSADLVWAYLFGAALLWGAVGARRRGAGPIGLRGRPSPRG
jgi:hypothetical protein